MRYVAEEPGKSGLSGDKAAACFGSGLPFAPETLGSDPWFMMHRGANSGNSVKSQ